MSAVPQAPCGVPGKPLNPFVLDEGGNISLPSRHAMGTGPGGLGLNSYGGVISTSLCLSSKDVQVEAGSSGIVPAAMLHVDPSHSHGLV